MLKPVPKLLVYDDFLTQMATWPEGVRYELIGGELFLMTGGTPDHDLIKGNVYLLMRRLFPNCYVTTGDANLKAECLLEENGYFPDSMVVCAEEGKKALYYDLPLVLIEVSSPGTQYLDRAKKKQDYMQLPSLRLYLIIDSTRNHVIAVYRKSGNTWEERYFTNVTDAIALPVINGLPPIMLPTTELYAKTGVAIP
jgi:Uma2 family endonuclease